jgi:hypothetical protein
MTRTDRESLFAWPEDLGPGYHYEAAHGRDAITAYLPALYLDNHGIMGVFAASLDAVREVLPSHDLHPVRLDRRHAAVSVGAFLYERWWCRADGLGVIRGDPYAEIVVAPLCTYGASAPPMVPLLGLPLPARWRMGMFVQHMPVTHWVASAAGRKIGNFPKFVGDVDWVRDAEGTTCRLTEGGHDILELAVRETGTIRALQDPIRSFTVQDGRLFRHDMPVSAAAKVTRSPGTARLRLGDHPVADDLRALGVDERVRRRVPLPGVQHPPRGARRPRAVPAPRRPPWRGPRARPTDRHLLRQRTGGSLRNATDEARLGRDGSVTAAPVDRCSRPSSQPHP